MEDLEDDIELEPLAMVAAQPRKLSRLKKASIAEKDWEAKVDTPEAEGRSSLALGASEDENEAEEAAADSPAPCSVELGGDDAGEDDAGGTEDGGEKEEGEPEAEYWDEEDEIENYLKDRFEGGESSDEEAGSDGGGESPAATGSGAPHPVLGDNPSMEDLAAETQRILRETAARDRLGKGQKIEIKPLSGIVEKLRERRALAIARAPKAKAPQVVNFDDIMAAATEAAPPAAAAPLEPAADSPAGPDAVPSPGAAAPAAGDEDGPVEASAGPEAEATPEEDLDIVSEDEGGGARVVELPSTLDRAPKPSPLTYMPYTQSRELEEYEEVLIEDGGDSGDESDDGSERSWEVRAGAGEGAGAGTEERSPPGNGAGSREEVEEEEEEEEEQSAASEESDEEGAGEGGDEEGGRAEEGKPAASPHCGDERPVADGIKAVMLGALGAGKPKHSRRLQKAFLDMEAELSDEDGGVSADEEDEDVDDRGELADLIASGNKESGKDKDLKDSLHRKWEAQKDAKELQQVLRGLEQGFRKRRMGGGLGDDDDEELDGRRRRARAGEDGDELDPGALLMWPAAWGVGGGGNGGGGEEEEEDAEGEEMLRRAKQQRLLSESRGPSQASPGAVPLDEDSQAMLGLLARSMSESQHGAGPALGHAPLLLGSEPSASLLRAPSFLGRLPAVARSTGALGLGGGRSYVFGQRDGSNSAAQPDSGAAGSKAGEPSGPSSFANLRQMADLPAGAAHKKRERAASSLVSRLGGSQGAAAPKTAAVPRFDAASAFCQAVVLGPPKNRSR